MTSRRQFFAGSASALLASALPRVARADTKTFPYTEFEQRIARKDFRGMTKDVLPTPCMVVDIDLFDKNLKTMADYAKTAPINLRPHVKVHKSVDVAKRQMALGAIGITAATIAESELMSAGGIKGVLWTKQPASQNNLVRAIALTKHDPTFMFVVDDSVVADWVDQAAAAAKVKCRVAVSVFAGLKRQGIENGQPASRRSSSGLSKLEGKGRQNRLLTIDVQRPLIRTACRSSGRDDPDPGRHQQQDGGSRR